MERSRAARADHRRARQRSARFCDAVGPLAMALMLSHSLAPQEAQARRGGERLLIVPLDQQAGRDDARLGLVEDAFRAEALALGRYRIAPREQASVLLDSVRSLGLDCAAGDLECLTKAGVIMEIDLLAVLRATEGAGRLIVSVVLVDVERGGTRALVGRSLGPDDSLREEMRSAAIELLAPDLFVGSLVIETDPGARVKVDGEEQGTTPLPGPIEGLTPGEHVLEVEGPGREPLERLVVIEPLATTRLTLPEPVAPPARATASPSEAPLVEPAPAGPFVDDASGREAPELSRSLPLLPVALSGLAALSALTATGVTLGAVALNARGRDTSLSVVERDTARELSQTLVVVGAASSAIALGAALGASASWLLE